ncbi:hypothetical protein OAW32_03350, partial [bacterium]|nr:hypothetical protein [bacterium]
FGRKRGIGYSKRDNSSARFGMIQNTIRFRKLCIIQTGNHKIMLQIYNNIMNSSKNPLSALPPAQRMQAMIILSVMWSTIFSLSTGA